MDSEPEEQEHNIYHRLVDAAEGRVSLSSHDAEDIIHLLTKLITVKTEKSKEEVEASIYDYLEQNSLFDDGLGNDHLDETFIHYLTTTYAKVYEDALTPHDYEIIGRPTLVTGETIYNLGDLIPSEPLKEVLSYIDDWNFNPFQLPPLTPYGLAFTVETILQRLHITSELDINEIKLRRYLCSIQDGYHDIPYHNYLHGADVAQTAYYICTKSNVIDALGMNTLSILAMIIGGAIHDVGHPGVNAKFLTTNSMPLAIQYNDISPLENMHLSTAFTLWLKNENNFTDKIPRVLYKDLRKMIIDMVLATDNDMHFTLVGKLNDLLATGELNVILHGSPQTTGHRPPLMSTTSVTLNPIGSRSRSASQSSSFTKGQIINNHPPNSLSSTPNLSLLPPPVMISPNIKSSPVRATRKMTWKSNGSDTSPDASPRFRNRGQSIWNVDGTPYQPLKSQQMLVLQTLLHAADISGPAKSWELHTKWTDLVMEEFYKQGDREREMNIPITFAFDRHNPVPLAKFQLGFIKAIVQPLYKSLSKVPGTDFNMALECLDENIRLWESSSSSSSLVTSATSSTTTTTDANVATVITNTSST